MNAIVATRLRMMRGSMRCLSLGLLALLPVVGLPFAAAALWLSGQVRVWERQLWNPAQPYRRLGVVCAALGTIGWFLVGLLLAILHVANSHDGSIFGAAWIG